MLPARSADPCLRSPAPLGQPVDHFLAASLFSHPLKDKSNAIGLLSIDLQATAPRIHIISEDWVAPQPFPLPACSLHLVPRPLRDEFPLELRKRQQNIE